LEAKKNCNGGSKFSDPDEICIGLGSNFLFGKKIEAIMEKYG